MHVPKETEVAFKDKKEIEQMDTQGQLFIARQPYLKAADFIEYGLKKVCPKCDHGISYGRGRTSKPHSMTCKKRILAKISKTPEGQARIVQASERLDNIVAEIWEMHRTDQPQGKKEEMVLNQGPPRVGNAD